MTDGRYHANAVRLRARFSDGRVLIEFLRRAGPSRVEGDGFYRACWPHDVQVAGLDLGAIKARVAKLPLATFAPDPDDGAAAAAPPQPRAPGGATAAAPRPAAKEPARRGFLAAHFSEKKDA